MQTVHALTCTLAEKVGVNNVTHIELSVRYRKNAIKYDFIRQGVWVLL